jgi:hypothetical protein
LGMVHLGLNQHEQALDAFEEAVEQHAASITWAGSSHGLRRWRIIGDFKNCFKRCGYRRGMTRLRCSEVRHCI